jgi:hypothetical protein
MTTISMHKNTAVWIVLVFANLIMLYDYMFPRLLIMGMKVWMTFFLLYELSLCCGHKNAEHRKQRAAEPATEVVAAARLVAKVGEDADETGDDHDEENDKCDRHASNGGLVVRRHQ